MILRYVVVNDRMLVRREVACPHCGAGIDGNYVREIVTGIVYCTPRCFEEAENEAQEAAAWGFPQLSYQPT